MNHEEKFILRIMFQNKIHKSDGQAFEDIFTSIMNYVDNDFISIKPWGNIGDRKNDGYIKRTGTYYQVFAPEDIKNSYPQTIKKLNEDLKGLLQQWSPVNEFYFVVNDKYKGIHPDVDKEMQMLKKQYGLSKAAILTAKDIEDMLFTLSPDQMFSVVGGIPNPRNMKYLDYSILNEVVDHIMELPLTLVEENIVVPNWEEKIQFNQLSETIAQYLEIASYQLHNLEEYLSNNSSFAAESLRERVSEVYIQEKEKYSGNHLFMKLVERLSPRNVQAYQNVVMIILAKYFEACDIFEEPKEEEK